MYEYDENKNFIGRVKNNILSPHAKFVRFSIGGNTDVGGVSQVMIYYGDDIKREYEPYKTNILTVNEDVTLRSNGDVYDELNLLTGRLTQRIDENNEVLAQEVVKTVDLSGDAVYSYNEVTHYDCSSEEGSLVPTLSIDVPTNLPALVSRQRATIENQKTQIQTLEIENEQLIEQNQVQDEDIALNQDAINFMLFASEMLADDNKTKGVNTMAAYLANQILKGKLDYSLVVSRYPQFKEDIDTILILEGEENLIK